MNGIDDFNALEKAVLEWIGNEYDDPILNEQIKHAKFVKRQWTGAGSFIYFEVPNILAPLDPAVFESFPFGDVTIVSEDIDLCGAAILWGKNGYINCIEMFCFGDFFNEEIRQFKLYDRESYNELLKQKKR